MDEYLTLAEAAALLGFPQGLKGHRLVTRLRDKYHWVHAGKNPLDTREVLVFRSDVETLLRPTAIVESDSEEMEVPTGLQGVQP